MEKKIKEVNGHYKENYFNDEIANRIKQKVHQKIYESEKVVSMYQVEKKPKWSVGKKIAAGFAASAALFGVFLGSAFVSPAMAEVASNIPFLSSIFHSKPVDQVLMEELQAKGYKISGTGYRVDGKVYSVSIHGSEEYYKKVKDDVKKITEDVIGSRGYDDYKVVVVLESQPTTTPSNDPRELLSDTVMKAVEEAVKNKNYAIMNYGAGFDSPNSNNITLDVTIVDTENRTDEIKQAIKEGLLAKNINNVAIKFHKVNLKQQELETKWSKVFDVVTEGLLGKKDYKTAGMGYSFKGGKFTFIISTTAEGAEATKLASKIKTAVTDFLSSDDLKDLVGNNPYEIIVKDNNGKNIK